MSKIIPINSLERVPLCEAVPLDTPFSVYIFPTTFCNFKCVYCAHSLGHKGMKLEYDFTPQVMNMDTYQRIIQQLGEFPHKIKLLSLTGHGEPLLNSNLPEMVSMAKTADIANRIEIITNASLLTKELADSLIASGLDGLRVSLQGMNSDKYKKVCGFNLDFDKFIGNLSYFYEHKDKCDLFVKVMDVALDKGEEDLFYQTFGGISDRMFIEHCRPVYSGVEFTEDLHNEVLDRYGNSHVRRDVCPLCFFQLCIFPNGDVVPCDAIYKPIVLGNVNASRTLREMFASKELKDFQIMQLHKKRNENPKCAVCVAPDDVSHSLDVLDDSAEAIIGRLTGNNI